MRRLAAAQPARPPSPELFPNLPPHLSALDIRCWLVASDLPQAETRFLLTERRAVIVDALHGRIAIAPEDLLLLWSSRSRQVECIGPAWLRETITFDMLGGHRLLDAPPFSLDGMPTIRSLSCTMLSFGSRADDSPVIPGSIEPFLARFWRSVRAPAATEIGSGELMAPALVGGMHLALATGMSARVDPFDPTSTATVFEHYKLAARWFETGGLGNATRRTEAALTSARESFAAARQLQLPAPVGAEAVKAAKDSSSLRLLAQPLSAIELPSLPLAGLGWGGDQLGDLLQADRELFFSSTVPSSCIEHWLAKTSGDRLRVSLKVGSFRPVIGPERGKTYAIVGRFRVGQRRQMSILVDNAHNQAFGIPSRKGGHLYLSVTCNGLRFEPEDLEVEVGQPLYFTATGLTEGMHLLSLIAHTGDRTLTSMVRTVEIVPPAQQRRMTSPHEQEEERERRAETVFRGAHLV